ncbi:MAG: EamA family transporter [Gammaproteobacteria bacterium]|nr:EamA family transporter [Gammaproteobacteria bacterium]MDE2252023.1 EamA family transporter [Gammaproteobacteria bacterium]
MKPSIAGPALLSALLFGVTTPLAKPLLASTPPLLVAGLLYLGSGLGLSLWVLARERGTFTLGIARGDWPWLGGAIAAGGIAAPALLMYGLSRTDAATASLLLNLEVVLTAVLAWVAFREATSGRVVLGFSAILAGCLLLSYAGFVSTRNTIGSMLAIAGACLCWALDNNLTRRVSAGDARSLAAVKGLAAGATNTALGLGVGATLPDALHVAAALGLGFLGYGVSLALFVYSLRHLGTARTGAYFATAPFIGGAVAIAMYGQNGGWEFWAAFACMAIGVWLHLTEHHDHDHVHEATTHRHAHVHDEHHQHAHAPDWDGVEPHSHEHVHAPLRHSHPHFPDLHHRHSH